MKKLFINLHGIFVNVIFFKLEMFYESYKLIFQKNFVIL